MAAKAHAFDVGDYVVYPKHGVGRVIELQEQEIAGMKLELYVLRFEKERMTLRVPMNKVEAIGMRKLSSDKTLREALDTLKGKPKVKRTMWSRRAQEYEAKINSGDLVSIAEVTRDLFRADDQPEQSYSERQIFEAASSRLARELAAMEKTDEPAALKKILAILNEHAPKFYETAAPAAGPTRRTGRSITGAAFFVRKYPRRPMMVWMSLHFRQAVGNFFEQPEWPEADNSLCPAFVILNLVQDPTGPMHRACLYPAAWAAHQIENRAQGTMDPEPSSG